MGVVGKESVVTVRVVGKGSMIAQASMCSKYSCMGHTAGGRVWLHIHCPQC